MILHRALCKSKIKSPGELALLLGKSKRTIQREIKRGWQTFQASDLSLYEAYSPDIADIKAKENLKAKGSDLNLGNDFTLVNDVQRWIKKERYSPAALIMHYEKSG